MNKDFVSRRTDKYFSKTKQIIEKTGDAIVEYGVFQRRDVIVAPQLAIDLIKKFCPQAEITLHYEEGTIIPPKTKVLTIKGPFSKLVELETLWLQKLGFAQVCAYNAYKMSLALPNTPFLDMHGRHATGDDMVESAAYGASVGSRTARLQGAEGFIGTSNDLTAHYFPTKVGMGTMPHALIGYVGNTLDALKLYTKIHTKDQTIIALVDYFGKEVSDGLECADWFYDDYLKQNPDSIQNFGIRLDTTGERFLEGLDYEKSVEIVSKWLKVFPADEYTTVRKVIGDDAFDAAGDGYIDKVRRHLFGKGVSAANILYMRKQFNKNNYSKALIVASSGFDLFKCQIMAKANIPINMVGTGSFLPATLSETYATADIFSYDGKFMVKVGREWLID